MEHWYREQGSAITLMVHVQPGAKHSAVAGVHGDALKIRLAAPPIEGRANAALLQFIAEQFAVPLRNVELKQGEQSRRKRVVVTGSAVHPGALLDDK
jgi:uncharacterized protein (TIGR00251 family)